MGARAASQNPTKPDEEGTPEEKAEKFKKALVESLKIFASELKKARQEVVQ